MKPYTEEELRKVPKHQWHINREFAAGHRIYRVGEILAINPDTKTAPDGFVFADGRIRSISGKYADLFSQIGYSFGGVGELFKFPDLRERQLLHTGRRSRLENTHIIRYKP